MFPFSYCRYLSLFYVLFGVSKSVSKSKKIREVIKYNHDIYSEYLFIVK